jgi:hypothetical protein
MICDDVVGSAHRLYRLAVYVIPIWTRGEHDRDRFECRELNQDTMAFLFLSNGSQNEHLIEERSNANKDGTNSLLQG